MHLRSRHPRLPLTQAIENLRLHEIALAGIIAPVTPFSLPAAQVSTLRPGHVRFENKVRTIFNLNLS